MSLWTKGTRLVYGLPWTRRVPLRNLLILALEFGFDGEKQNGEWAVVHGDVVVGLTGASRNGIPVAGAHRGGPRRGRRAWRGLSRCW
jgi:hypothetical protein